MTGSYLNVKPSPSALIQSLRDIGYSMESAIADVIDNSITAEASNIHIRFSWNDGTPWLAVIDNGHGMASAELTNAMRLGSQNPLEDRSADDLGRFGLGMKTASFSQCCQLTLVSRKNGELSCREWDLDQIERDPDSGWRLRVLERHEIEADLVIKGLLPLVPSRGTIVLWRKLDRFDNSEKKLNSMVEQAKSHIELVFHRFMAPGGGKRRVQFLLNNAPMEAFNPFNPAHLATQELAEQTIYIEGQTVKVQPYVLPHYNKISREEYEKYAGEGGYLQNQGFYVYRNRRLIVKGTWFRLLRKDELTKLLRVQIDIPNSLDHLWKIDVKKSHASPPEIIRNELKQIIDRIAESGKKVYRQRGQRIRDIVTVPAWNRIAAEGKIFYTINTKHPLLTQLYSELTEKKQRELKQVLRMLESSFPIDSFYCDAANRPEEMCKPVMDIEQVAMLLDGLIEQMLNAEIPAAEIAARILAMDPFATASVEVSTILKQKGYLNGSCP